MNQPHASDSPTNPPDAVTVVCCIEAGRLEEQTLRMLRTLRRWGGRLAAAPVMAVAPRRNAPLAPSTLAALKALDVEYVRDYSQHPLPWFNFANKVAATLVAERSAATPYALWLDSDIFVAGEPAGCLLSGDADFAGRGEPLPPATSDPGDPYEPYWRAVCKLLGIDFDSVPFLQLDPPQRPIRLHINGGVYSWRRGCGFAEASRDNFMKVMRSRLTPPNGEIALTEQMCLGITAHGLGLRFRHLDRRDNHMIFGGMLTGPGASPPMNDANIIHYSQSASGANWPVFLERLRNESPEIHDWLAPQGPIQNQMSTLQRAVYLPFKAIRNVRYKVQVKRVIPVTA